MMDAPSVGAADSKSSFSHAFANLLKSMIGSGILTLPYVTSKVGLGISLPGLAILAFFTQAAIRVVVRCAAQVRASGYADLDNPSGGGGHGDSSWKLVSQAAFGQTGWAVTCTSLTIAQLGVTSSYLDFVGNALMAYFGLSALGSRLTLLLVVGAMSMIKTLKNVALVSMTSLAVYTIIFVLIGYYGFRAPPHPDTPIKWFDLSGFGAWFGPCLFAFEGIGPSLAIFESLGEPSGVTFFRVITTAYVFAVFFYMAVATIGYVAWGDGVASVVIHSFPHNGLTDSARGVLALVLALTYPIQIAPVFQTAERWVESVDPSLSAAWPLVRILIVGATCAASYAIPDMEKMVGLTGALAFSSMGFILPGLFYLKLRPPQPGVDGTAYPSPDDDRRDTALAVGMIALGVVGGVWGVYSELSTMR